MVLGDSGCRALHVDARETEERREEIDVTGGSGDPCGSRGNTRSLEHERDADRLVERVVPLLHQAAVRPEQVAMVGGAHDDRVVAEPGVVERLEDAFDRAVDELVQVVVEAPVREIRRLVPQDPRPGLLELLLAARPSRERVRLRRRLGDLGHGVVGRSELEDLLPAEVVERDVVRVDERRNCEPRTVASRRGELPEELDDLFREDAVAHRAAVGSRGTVGLAPDPTGEPERVEPVGLPVRLDGFRDEVARIVRRHESFVGAGDEEVRVRDVPLPSVVGLVPAGPEPVAHGRHRAGVEPQHCGVGRALRGSVGLAHSVQRRVLTSEERRAARQAGRRPDVVTVELESTVAQGLLGR